MSTVTTTPAVPQNKTEAVAQRRLVPMIFDELRDDLQHFWDRPWSPLLRPFGPPLRRLGKSLAEWAPRMDVYEKDGSLVLKADLPGLKREDIEVKLENGDLVVSGERKEEKEVKEEDLYRCERSFGSFYRRIPLDFAVDPKQVVARFADGVLEVKLPVPREEAPEGQRIAVS